MRSAVHERQIEKDKPSSSYLLFSVNRCIYAVRVPFVEKIVRIPRISPLPLVAPHILGAAKANGEVCPVIDLRILFGERPAAAPSSAVLLTYRGARLCAVVDSVLSVVDFNTEGAVCPPAGAPWITGVIHSDTMSINLLSMEHLFFGHKSPPEHRA